MSLSVYSSVSVGVLRSDGYEDEVEGAELFLGGHKLMVHESNAEDPYVTVPDHVRAHTIDDKFVRCTDRLTVRPLDMSL